LLLAAVDISFALYAEQQQHRGIEISCIDSFGKGFPWQMGRFRAVTDCLLCGLSASIPRTITVQLRFPSKFSLGQFMITFNYEHFSRGSADVYLFSARGGRFGQKGKKRNAMVASFPRPVLVLTVRFCIGVGFECG
jgi:hypothetical protein